MKTYVCRLKSEKVHVYKEQWNHPSNIDYWMIEVDANSPEEACENAMNHITPSGDRNPSDSENTNLEAFSLDWLKCELKVES